MNIKALVFQRKPLSRIHDVLTSQGFKKIGISPSVTYRATLRDSSTESSYCLEIPVFGLPENTRSAKLGKPRLYGEERIPESVRMAAESKLHEIADYLRSSIRRTAEKVSKHNSSMAGNEKEVKQLGKEMESIKTHKELQTVGLTSDPIPYE